MARLGNVTWQNTNNVFPVIKCYVMTARSELKVQNQAFLCSALDLGECTVLCPVPFIREKRFPGSR